MKSLKKLLAVLLVVAFMTGLIAVPAFAASFEYEDAAKVLNKLNLFKGKSEAEYTPALEDRLLREEAVALLLRMFDLEDEALAMSDSEADDLLGKFDDANAIATWARKHVAYAVKNGIVVGRPDGKFAPQDNLIGREYAKMVLAMLGYVQDVDFEYKFSSSEFASVTGFSSSSAAAFDETVLIRDDVVGMSFFALQAEYFAGPNAGKTVIEVIVGDDADKKAVAIDAGLMEDAVVVSVAELDDIVITVGEALVLPATVKATYSDGREADVAVIWESVDATQPMEATEIEGTIAGTDVVAKINVTIEALITELLVDNVYADNLVEVNVEYNQDVSGNAAVKEKDNYSLSSGKIDSISVDGNVAVLRLAAAVGNQTPAKLTVKDKILTEAATIEFVYFDATLPEVLGVEASGPKELTVTFSEPMAKVGNITIKSGSSTLSVNYGSIVPGAAKITVPLYSTLADGKDYTIAIKDFEDYAEYKNVIKTITYSYVKDTSAPVAEVTVATQEYVVVEFNKPVEGLTKAHFSHTFSAWNPTKVTSDADGLVDIAADKSYSKVYAWFYTDDKTVDKPIPEGSISFRILAKVGDDQVKDLWGNKFEDATITITVAADKTAPEVKEIKVTKEDEITIEFTKKVSFGKDQLEILSGEEKEIDGLTLGFDPSNEATKFTVSFSKNLAGKTIIVNIKNVYDATLNSNKLDFYSDTLDITDKTAPKVTEVNIDQSTKVLYVFYSEDVDEETALDISNYYLKDGNVYTKLSEDPEFFEDGRTIVKISLKDAEYDEANKDGATLFITGVKDLAGNEIAPTVTGVFVKISEKKPEIDKANAVKLDTIELFFKERMALVDKDAFEITIDGDDVIIADMSDDLVDGVTKLTFRLDEEMPYDAADVVVAIVNGDLLKNLFDISPDNASKGVADKIAPVLAKIEQDGDNVVKLTFEEDIEDANFGYMTFDFVLIDSKGNTLEPGTGYRVTDVTNDTIKIELIRDDAYEGKLTVKTADTIRYTTDKSNNKIAEFKKDVTLEAEDA